MPKKKTTKRATKKVLTPGFKKIELNQEPQWDLSNKDHIDWNKQWEELEIPHLRGGDWKWNFEKKPMSLQDKITWVLTAVNVAILISLVIKNV